MRCMFDDTELVPGKPGRLTCPACGRSYVADPGEVPDPPKPKRRRGRDLRIGGEWLGPSRGDAGGWSQPAGPDRSTPDDE